MYDKEVENLYKEQIKSRDDIITKLLDERMENRKINRLEFFTIIILAFMIFVICMTFVLSYFFSDYEVQNFNSNTNTNEVNVNGN